jgi:ribosomal protein S21
MPIGPIVLKKDNENINSVLKRFRRECNKSGTKNDLKKRRFFLAPSEITNVNDSKIKRLRLKDARRAEKKKEFIKTKKRRG